MDTGGHVFFTEYSGTNSTAEETVTEVRGLISGSGVASPRLSTAQRQEVCIAHYYE